MEAGVESAPRGNKVYELRGPSQLILRDTSRPFLLNKTRKPNYRFGFAEAMWILSGSESVDIIAAYNKQMRAYSDDGRTLWGAYGPRLMGQMPHVISKLMSDPDTRQAIAMTWRPMVPAPEDGELAKLHPAGMMTAGEGYVKGIEWDGASWLTKDTPCTVMWQFQIVDGYLDLTVTMRSNDVWWGLPYDLLSFTTVQRVIAAAIGLKPGVYTHCVNNLHIYEPHFEKALEVMQEPLHYDLECYGDVIKVPDVYLDFEGLAPDGIVENIMNIAAAALGGRAIHDTSGFEPFVAAVNRGGWRRWPSLREATGWKRR